MEVFKSSERYECEELYRAREYNRVREYVAHKEIYRSAEVNIQSEGSLPKADRKEQQQSRVRKKLLMAGSSFSAVGAAVGAVIIMAATITAAAVLSVKETFSDITSYSIEVQFEIENKDAVELTATLKGGEKRLEYQLGGQDSVYFDLNVYVNTVDASSVYIYKDSPILIKLSDGEIIRLYCNKDGAWTTKTEI